jgi:hypothetical protein
MDDLQHETQALRERLQQLYDQTEDATQRAHLEDGVLGLRLAEQALQQDGDDDSYVLCAPSQEELDSLRAQYPKAQLFTAYVLDRWAKDENGRPDPTWTCAVFRSMLYQDMEDPALRSQLQPQQGVQDNFNFNKALAGKCWLTGDPRLNPHREEFDGELYLGIMAQIQQLSNHTMGLLKKK